MLALEYRPSLARYAAARVAPRTARAGLRLARLRPPPLPASDWLPLRPRLSGICGSDQALLSGGASPYLASVTSGPFVPGHEVVAQVMAGERRGQRVVLEPALGCAVRGVQPPCPECVDGRPALCREVTNGAIGAGLQTGFCRDTGGGWSEGLVAHPAQLHPIPSDLDDEDAVLVEPLACALHAARAAAPRGSGGASPPLSHSTGQAPRGSGGASPRPASKLAVIGAGTIGLLTVAALRELHPSATVLAVAKHRGQELEARRMGADATCAPGRLHLEGARLTGARRLVGHQGRELLMGGFDAVLDCVGSGASIEAAVTATRPRGRVVLAGMPAGVSVDLALAWQRELELRGAYGYRGDFAAAIELARRLRPGRLVAHGWGLRDYRRALDAAPRAARAGKPKTVFDMRDAA